MSQDKVHVVFCRSGNKLRVARELGDCYILTPDNWDDYGYKTSFSVQMYKDGELYEAARKILLENQVEEGSSSGSYFEEELDGALYVEIADYTKTLQFISLGSDYTELTRIFPEDYIQILQILNDVIYLENKEPENELLKLKGHPAFEVSLCRDQSSKKVLEEGKEFLFGVELDENRFDFEFSFELSHKNYKYHFDFNKKEELPHRINVLIGKNGSGKSQTLLALSEYLLNNKLHSVDKHPAFIANMMIFAYNPYETFVVTGRKRKYDIDYKYLGLKRPKRIFDIELAKLIDSTNIYNTIQELSKDKIIELEKEIDSEVFLAKWHYKVERRDESIKEIAKKCNILEAGLLEGWSVLSDTLDQDIVDINTPQHMLFLSFKEIYIKDRNNLSHEIQIDDILYRDKIFEYINKAFNCDALALKFLPSADISMYSTHGFKIYKEYLILDNDRSKYTLDLNFEEFENKLYFFNDEDFIFLSSGQQTFVDLVVNILSLIKPNSLILIDEPENTLHPNLEVDFIRILHSILDDFESFAIIATHSSIIAREVPSQFVKVIKIDDEGQPVITQPSINTFGADIGTITNYVFDDIFKEEKAYENWFLQEKQKYNSFEEFEEKYRTVLNYDFLLYCKNSWSSER